ncbi:MAG: helix-turn-helix transcriptional regulator [Armatimonadota bacterium]
MQAALLPYLTVYVGNAIRHEWKPGDALLGADAETPRLWLVTDGGLQVRLRAHRGKTRAPEPDRDYALAAGEGLLLPVGTLRDIKTPKGGSWYSVGLTAALFGTLDLLMYSYLPLLLSLDKPDCALLQTLFARLILEEKSLSPYRPEGVRQVDGAGLLPGQTPTPEPNEDAFSLLMRRSLGEAIFSLIGRGLGTQLEEGTSQWGFSSGTAVFAGWPPWLPEILGAVSRDTTLSIDDIADRAGMTEVQVRRAFRRHLGVTPSEYLRRARLDAARRLLATTDWTVAAITERVGFESPSHFTRLFKNTFGYPPAQHRRLGA